MGVVAIFDPFDGPISHHIQSICDAKDIPHIETRWEFKSNRNDPESINLFPRTSLLTKAYVDIVKAWNWEHFAIVYENNEGIIFPFLFVCTHFAFLLMLFNICTKVCFACKTFLKKPKLEIGR